MLKGVARHPAARNLQDDAAVLPFGSDTLILTHDMMAAGVHFMENADAGDVAWKLVAVNLSDLAAKGAMPVGVLLGFTLGDEKWDRAFAHGLGEALHEYDVPLLGGDTVASNNVGGIYGFTAIGRATSPNVPSRGGAEAGDILYVTGVLGDALGGFEQLQSGGKISAKLAAAYNRPVALLDHGQMLAGKVSAMMDVSDGLLIDAGRMANASRLSVKIDLAALPLSNEYCEIYGDDRESRLRAASWGDDYQLLFSAPKNAISPDLLARLDAAAVGHFEKGSETQLYDGAVPVPLPPKLGYQHG